MIQSQMRAYLDRPIRLECSLGITPIQTLPMIGQKWCEQALRTLTGPTIISSLSRSAFGNSVTGGIAHVAAPEHLVDEHLGHAPGGVVGVVVALGVDHQGCSTPCILAATSSSSSSSSPSLDEGGDVVVGVEAAVGADQPIADALRRGEPLQLFLVAEQLGRAVSRAWAKSS